MTSARKMSRNFVWSTETLIILVSYAAYCSVEAKGDTIVSKTGIVRYLFKEAVSTTISKFQSFVRIKGIDRKNVERIHQTTVKISPRCGVEDKMRPKQGDRSKRYALDGDKWETKNLTYKISKYPTQGLSRPKVDREIARAFDAWSNHTDLRFSLNVEEVDIEISFVGNEHGDGFTFEDPDEIVLAHTFSPGPGLGGDIHFNNEIEWTMDSDQGINLFQVAVHEIGHSLGLDHTDSNETVMAPHYTEYNAYYDLHSDDIAGIQALYGPKTTEDPQICDNPDVDLIFDSPKGHTYVFKGAHYWEITDQGFVPGYPKLIAKKWKGLPSDIDGGITFKGATGFIKGSKYWRYIGDEMDGDYPKEISEIFIASPGYMTKLRRSLKIRRQASSNRIRLLCTNYSVIVF